MQAELRPEVSEAGSQADLPAAAAAAADARPVSSSTGSQAAAAELDELPPISEGRKDGSGIIYSASGSELSVEKAAVGQQLDILHRIERSRAGDAPTEGEGVPGAVAVADVKPEDLKNLPAVAKGGSV